MKSIAWDLYQLFLVVARKGGLSAAATASGMSAPTLGRRMLELEQGLGRELFQRSQTGYELTADGRALLEQLKDMESAVRKVDAWQGSAKGDVLVRIAAGTWIGLLISENFSTLWQPHDGFRVELTIGEQRAGLAYRENDIGIRAFAPEEPNLASRPAGEVAYAPFRARNSTATGSEVWLAVDRDNANSAYLRWPHEQVAGKIMTTVNRPRSLRDLALSGAGIAVLPCVAGDLEPGLERAGEEIKELRHRQWIVMNNDDRHRPEIRTVLDRLSGLLGRYRDVLAGRRPGQIM